MKHEQLSQEDKKEGKQVETWELAKLTNIDASSDDDQLNYIYAVMLHAIICNMRNKRIAKACRVVSRHFQGEVTLKYFEWYDAINNSFFASKLPQAFILQALTPYGSCIALTKTSNVQPIILLHPILQKSKNPDKEEFYTLLHEAIHVNVAFVLKNKTGGKSSHESGEWISEVNRIAKMLGYSDVTLGVSKVERQKKKHGGKLKRVSTGTIPYECTYNFPQALAAVTGQTLPDISTWINTQA